MSAQIHSQITNTDYNFTQILTRQLDSTSLDGLKSHFKQLKPRFISHNSNILVLEGVRAEGDLELIGGDAVLAKVCSMALSF